MMPHSEQQGWDVGTRGLEKDRGGSWPRPSIQEGFLEEAKSELNPGS